MFFESNSHGHWLLLSMSGDIQMNDGFEKERIAK